MIARKLASILFCATFLFVQGLPIAPTMVGCSMDPEESACSKWAAPNLDKCCCAAPKAVGSSCCAVTARKAAWERCASVVAQRAGCDCRLVGQVTSNIAIQTDRTSAAHLVLASKGLPKWFIPDWVGVALPRIQSSDSTPPGKCPIRPDRGRAPPIDA